MEPRTEIEHDKAAPLPWASAEANRANLPRQKWNPEVEERVYFTLRFEPTRKEHWHCDSRIVWVRPTWFLAVAVFLLLVTLLGNAFDYLMACWKSHHWLIPKWSLLFQPVRMVLELCVVMLVSQYFTTRNRIEQMMKAKVFACTLTVTSTYLECDTFPKPVRVTYKQLRDVVYAKGDIYVLGYPLQKCFYIPRSTFADTDSREMLYEAIYSLWKGNGSLNALSAEVRARFLPETGAAVEGNAGG